MTGYSTYLQTIQEFFLEAINNAFDGLNAMLNQENEIEAELRWKCRVCMNHIRIFLYTFCTSITPLANKNILI